MKAIKQPIEIEFYPFERKYYNEIMAWSTNERPIVITIPRSIDGISIATITTMEGVHTATEGVDVIIKGVKGEVYPCKKDIFDQTYTIVA